MKLPIAIHTDRGTLFVTAQGLERIPNGGGKLDTLLVPGTKIEISGKTRSHDPRDNNLKWRYLLSGREITESLPLKEWQRPVMPGTYTVVDHRPVVVAVLGGSSGDALADALHTVGFRVLLVLGQANEPGHDRADELLIHDLRDTHFVVQEITKRADILLVGNAHLLSIQIADRLAKEYLFPINIPIEPLWLEKDKVRMKRKILAEGLLTPDYFVVGTPADAKTPANKIKTPCVIKPAMDSCQAQYFDRPSDALGQVTKIVAMGDRAIIEEYIRGCDITVPVASCGSQVQAYRVIYYNKAKEYGLVGFPIHEHRPLNVSQENHACRAAEAIVRAGGFTGIPRVDIVWSNEQNQPYILEVNGVLVLGYTKTSPPYFRAAGLDLASDMVRLMMGDHIAVFDGS